MQATKSQLETKWIAAGISPFPSKPISNLWCLCNGICRESIVQSFRIHTNEIKAVDTDLITCRKRNVTKCGHNYM